MTKVRFFCGSGTDIHSGKNKPNLIVLDTVKDLGLDKEEWESYSENQRLECVKEWTNQHITIYYKDE